MTVKAHKKKYLVDHISNLFKFRTETFKDGIWYCVLRNDQLMVIRPSSREIRDKVVIHCYLKPGKSPSKVSIYLALRKNRQVLSELSSERLNKLIDHHPAGANCIKVVNKKIKYIANLKLCLNQFKSFFENNLRWMRL
jgi:hypothetical protein